MARPRSLGSVQVMLALAVSFTLVDCTCDSTGGELVKCDTDADCTSLGPSFVCDADSGRCMDTGTGGDGGTVDGGGGDGGTGDGGSQDGGTTGTDCSSATDCEPSLGAAPCGSWECNNGFCDVVCSGCTDFDLDGYGPEAGACAGPDCDDNDDTIFSDHTRTCYSGPSGTEGVGTCQGGAEVCRAGVWTPCQGEVTPSGEACNDEDDDCDAATDESLGIFTCGLGACETTVNACTGGSVGVCSPGAPLAANDNTCDGVDDDCDGSVDEDCLACNHVTQGGDDATADGSQGLPFRTIQAAIDDADIKTTGGNATKVCVSGGANCGQTATYAQGPGNTVVMVDGISVYGSYEETNWTRCGSITTAIRPGAPEGVRFDDDILNPTVLDSFEIQRFNAPTTAGVTADGAINVLLTNLFIPEIRAVTNAYGVNVIAGADVFVTRSNITGGRGNALSIGVRVDRARVSVTNNCSQFEPATGYCTTGCFGGSRYIRGQADFNFSNGDSASVWLIDAPGSLVESNTMCGSSSENGASVRVTGVADGVVIRGNWADSWGGTSNSHGIWLEDCGGAAPWIVDNYQITAFSDRSGSSANGVHSVGDCHPVIDSNVLIRGGGEASNPSDISGVFCGANRAGTPSRCVVLGNASIQGSTFGFPTTAAGVRCADGSCVRVANNVINGVSGEDVYGVYLDATGTFVDNNRITGGCGATSATGLHSENSWARIQNNRIFAGGCNVGGIAGGDFYGVHISNWDGGNEIDFHSNYVDGEGRAGVCISHGLHISSGRVPPTGGKGVYRNNIIRGGQCQTSYAVNENDATADPRIFENNDLDPTNTTDLYNDEASSVLVDPAAVDGLTDMTASGNISADPVFVNYPSDLHLLSGQSPCEDAGTPNGAPRTDMDGDVRDLVNPDIGPDEL